MRTRRIIALLTDFGTGDMYTAAMKGVIGQIAPETNVIDISHQVGPGAVEQAAFLLWSAHNYFPKGTVFVAVVDPGVGGKRSILCVEIAGRYFLAPDNGILKYVLLDSKAPRCVKVQNQRFMEKRVSRTFHGRDIFAPAAAFLASGTPMARLGPAARPVCGAEAFAAIVNTTQPVTAKVLHVDRFGNCITNVLLPKERRPLVAVTIGRTTVGRFADSYEGAKPHDPFLLRGSNDLLEISVRNGSAADLLRVSPGQKLTVKTLRSKGKGGHA